MSEFFNPNFNNFESKKLENVYGKEKFPPEQAKEKIDELVNNFKTYYSSLNYKEISSVPISSGIDSTVRFIGSHISVMKPFLTEKMLPHPGVFMRQDCLRTHNVNKLLDDEFHPQWGSYFTSIGVLSSPERLYETCDEVFKFLEDKLNISKDHILIRINSQDKDLLRACHQNYDENSIEVDKQKSSYYRHDIGLEGVQGRNFNIALRNSQGEGFSDIGNVIVLENNDKPVGVEVALGTSVILKQLYGLEHVQDCNPVIGLESYEDQLRRKFEDSIITSTVLFREGLRPFGQHNRNRILKKYVRTLSYFRAKVNMDVESLSNILSNFEKREFPTSSMGSADLIIEFVKAFEKELISKNTLSQEDQKIRKELLKK